MVFLWILVAAVIVYIIKGVIIVQQAEAVIVERLGRFERELSPGFNFIFPIFEAPRSIAWKITQKLPNGESYSYIKERTKIDLREAVYDFPRQNVITKDNVTISINALLYFQVINPKSAVYEIQNLPEAIEKLTQTTLRNLVGALDLDETLVSRDKINHELRAILDDATNKWGVKVNRVELQECHSAGRYSAGNGKANESRTRTPCRHSGGRRVEKSLDFESRGPKRSRD